MVNGSLEAECAISYQT